MPDQNQEYRHHHSHRDNNLGNAPAHHLGDNGADVAADHIVPDQYGQHPVGSFHRYIAQILLDPQIIKGYNSLSAAGKILTHLFKAGSFLHIRRVRQFG